MPKRNSRPTALTIAGSDSGGGAGIQADLKTFTALGVHGTTAITCLTAQNPQNVLAVQAAQSEVLRLQLEAVFNGFPVKAIKTGMLFSSSLIETVVRFLKDHRGIPLVVDPVMVATSGAQLLKPTAIRMLRDDLLPLSHLTTPNLKEASILMGEDLEDKDLIPLKQAARVLAIRYRTSVLIKGGHGPDDRECVDVFSDGRRERVYRSPRIPIAQTHGTGCTLSAAITACLAKGWSLHRSIATAKDYINHSIREAYYAGTQTVLSSKW